MVTTTTTTTTMNTTMTHYGTQQRNIGNIGKKALIAALTIAGTNLIAAEAFQVQPMVMVSSIGRSRAAAIGSSSGNSKTKLNYVTVFGGDQATTDTIIGIEKSRQTKTVKTIQTANKSNKHNEDHHGYIVANHDDERSFWLHTLQNLESSSKSTPSKRSLWTRIACAYAPLELRETCSRIQEQQFAVLVRVGDTDLDIALAVPSDSYKESEHKHNESESLNANVVSVANDSRKGQLVTIRVEFPEGSSFDKDAFSFEDELAAVIRQVRLLEQTANNKLSRI